jgi:hypothetical protein
MYHRQTIHGYNWRGLGDQLLEDDVLTRAYTNNILVFRQDFSCSLEGKLRLPIVLNVCQLI